MPATKPIQIATLLACILCLACSGCSSLGLSCFPSGHFLTDKAEAVLNQSPQVGQSVVPRELDLGVVPVHYLQPGDALLIEPVELDSEIQIPGDQRVMADGSIDLGKYGRVLVAGLTLEMTENLIRRTIVDTDRDNQDAGERKKDRASVNVRLLEPVTRYYVLGEVHSPGSYPLTGNETVLDGILTAGGLTSSAAPCKILLARPTQPCSCRVTLPVCYREITQLGDTTTNYQLQPGDRIFVATRSWCEELKFWQATKTCPRCCGKQTACADPAIVSQINPMGRLGTTSAPIDTAAESTASLDGITIETNDPLMDFELDTASSNGLIQEASPIETKTGERATETSVPDRLPSTADGELDFSAPPTPQRFEPFE